MISPYPQMKKSLVNGDGELPLYTFLKGEKGFAGFDDNRLTAVLDGMLKKADPDYAKKPSIKWNFTKFIVDREGTVRARFEPTADMAKVEEFVKGLL